MFSEALRLYTESQDKDAATRQAAARDVLQMFDLIVAGYPDSIPAKSILAGGKVGPIDLAALKALAGVEPDADAAIATTDTTTAATTPPADADADAAGSLNGLLSAMEGLVPVVPRLRVPPWHRMFVAGATLEGGYHHGQFPSFGQRTHPGLDLIAACGSAVVSPWAGTVERVAKPDSADFQQLGNAVFVTYSHAADGSDTKDTSAIHVAYLGLGAAPTLAAGDAVSPGQRLGVTGKLHDLDGCGVHLEVRTFPATTSGLLPLWHLPLAVGDWRADEDFLSGWHDPDLWLPWVASQQTADGTAPVRLAGQDWVSFYSRSGPMGVPIEKTLWARTLAGDILSSRVSVTLNRDSSLQIVVSKIGESTNNGRYSVLLRGRTSDEFYLGVRFLKQGKVVSGVSKQVRLFLDSDGWAKLPEDVNFSLDPDYYLSRQPDSIEFALVGGATKQTYPLGELETSLLFHGAFAVDQEEKTLRDMRDLARSVTECLQWTLPDGVLLSVPVQAMKGGLSIDMAQKIVGQAERPEDIAAAEAYGKTLPATLAACPAIKTGPKTGAGDDWTGVDMVLGWPVQ